VHVLVRVLDTCSNALPHGTVSMAFGTYVNTSNSYSTLTYSLANGQCNTPTVSLDGGQHYSGGSRRMANGASYLNYDIYEDSGYTTVYPVNQAVTIPYSSNHYYMNFYGKLPSGQSGPNGTYSDTVTATVNY
jgi:spore coat protein U-like protein